ncbi:hypothetical protein J2794_005773 [Paraburkholderia terricola]|uniref:hypothetical protein n=1 Tax=Paraburkholderia terricola TaxID=169427 RepID=UPI002867AC0F|nr:hypothetical protein [Paraburkholderia terricola]MDR6449635.1 hypothetical protein [Paraburkholderia terricola]
MTTELKRGCDLKRGDMLRTWFGNQTILELLPYSGPFDFICGVAKLPDAEMSIDRGGRSVVCPIT